MIVAPQLTLERRLLQEHPIVIACDEVGRGAIAGPVAVGAAVLDVAAAEAGVPDGLRDSKLVPEVRRADVAARAAAWTTHSAVGWAGADEIDEFGIMRALGLAAIRALTGLGEAGVSVESGIVLLDGNHDYITAAGARGLRVLPQVKADRDCASASAASVIAKVARDAEMAALHAQLPVYGWERNKGYGSAAHRDAIRTHGVSVHHRRSWAIAAAPAALF